MSMIDLIKSVPLFYDLYEEEIEYIIDQCRVVKFRDGDLIAMEGERAQDFLIMLEGTAQVSKEINGNYVDLNILHKGEIYGETILINEASRITSLSSLGPSTILVVDQKTIVNVFRKKPKIFSIMVLNLARILSNKIHSINQNVIDQMKQNAS